MKAMNEEWDLKIIDKEESSKQSSEDAWKIKFLERDTIKKQKLINLVNNHII